jgi:glutamate N-acetyltransferase/amino-acid N-acetyltransferase
MTRVLGFRFSAVAAGIKKAGGLDVGLLVADEVVSAAGVFTRNLVRAAPVEVAEERVASGRLQAVLVNAGNANACTGEPGLRATLETTRAIASALGVDERRVAPASTGVIGAVLPAEKILAKVPELVERLSADGAEDFAQAILTTDRWKKTASATVTRGGHTATFFGMAKGAGMIHPDLGPARPLKPAPAGPPHATMLAFVVTDAVVDPQLLQQCVERAAELTFNACSVDGDTSTNDTLLVLASGRSGVAPSPEEVTQALLEVCRPLAREMVRDGEGAEHAVDITVRGLVDDAAARQIAQTVATSPLVKTALYGKDANWGRLLAAAGRAGVPFDPAIASVSIGGVCICERGLPVGGAAEAKAGEIMRQNTYGIELVLGDGPGAFTYVTSDFGHGYVDVNAGYRS